MDEIRSMPEGCEEEEEEVDAAEEEKKKKKRSPEQQRGTLGILLPPFSVLLFCLTPPFALLLFYLLIRHSSVTPEPLHRSLL